MMHAILIVVSALCLWRSFVHAWRMNGSATFEQRLLNASIAAVSSGVLWAAGAALFKGAG